MMDGKFVLIAASLQVDKGQLQNSKRETVRIFLCSLMSGGETMG